MVLDFDWDENKNEINLERHGIDFYTAALVFGDENYVEYYDEPHSKDEDRYVVIGMAGDVAVLLQVVYTPRNNGKTIRIISARKATKEERRLYYGEI
ncbi:MAG: BrnT family toxin [Firmicutes bacterium]|nr:BrnT family toxin [[Eubacterium] siraeum]MCM1488359.1 BrnT family toxin [Bacillota bacterium]